MMEWDFSCDGQRPPFRKGGNLTNYSLPALSSHSRRHGSSSLKSRAFSCYNEVFNDDRADWHAFLKPEREGVNSSHKELPTRFGFDISLGLCNGNAREW